MKDQRSTSLIAVLPILLLLVGSFVFSSCESSRVGPELPAPNPPVPPAQPLVLTGFVKDLANLSPISAAIVKIAKADNTVLTTLLTDNNGKYAYDASNVTESALGVSATKDGYAFKGAIASLVKTSNSASVNDILLAKLVVVSAPVTVAAGGSATTTNTQSVAAQPLSISVPPNAVSAPITLTAAAIPAGQIPRPTTTANTAVQSAGQFGPSGTTFTQPVTITFPLPSFQTAGKTFALLQLNEQTGAYTNSGFTATVDASGTRATASVTHFTIYALTEDATANLVDGTTTTGSSTYYGLASGSGTQSFSATNIYSATGGSGTVSDIWLKDIISQKLAVNFATSTITIGGNFPTLPANYQINGVQTNPNVPGKGNWQYRWYVLKQTTPTTGTASGTGWSRTINVVKEKWINDTAKTGWYWISHDQGGAVAGPY